MSGDAPCRHAGGFSGCQCQDSGDTAGLTRWERAPVVDHHSPGSRFAEGHAVPGLEFSRVDPGGSSIRCPMALEGRCQSAGASVPDAPQMASHLCLDFVFIAARWRCAFGRLAFSPSSKAVLLFCFALACFAWVWFACGD